MLVNSCNGFTVMTALYWSLLSSSPSSSSAAAAAAAALAVIVCPMQCTALDRI